MIPILSVAQTRDVEKLADESGVSYAEMMERAGRATAERALAVIRQMPQTDDLRVTVLVGPGNNGGDGLVAGRILAEAGAGLVRFYLTKRRDPAADPVFAAAQAAGIFTAYAEDDLRFRVLHQMIASAALVIDALYGIGVALPLRDDAVRLLRAIHKALDDEGARPYILAVDCPSGLDCDAGTIDANALPADETISFIAARPGLLRFPGAAHVGRLRVASLDLPGNLKPLKSAKSFLVDAPYVTEHLPPRPLDGHKGTYGRALVVGGSVNYVGAPGLAALAGYRSGAGLVAVGAPGDVTAALAGRLLETTWVVLPSDLGVLSRDAARLLRDEAARSAALLFGPGVGREQTTRALLAALLGGQSPAREQRGIGFADHATRADPPPETGAQPAAPPLVIDADGLFLLGEIADWHTLLPPSTVLTPHPGEMARLCGLDARDVQAGREALAQEKAKAWGCVIVLKGAHTVIAAPDGRMAVLPFKTSALATAGTGDVLAGMIVGLLAQRMSAFEAAVCAGYAHGLAGELAAERLGSTRAVIASDVLASLADAWSAVGSA